MFFYLHVLFVAKIILWMITTYATLQIWGGGGEGGVGVRV
jgi:hypothetical protein